MGNLYVKKDCLNIENKLQEPSQYKDMSYQYRDSQIKDKTVVRPSYL